MKLNTLFIGMLFLVSILACNPTSELSNHFEENKTFSFHETEQLLSMLSAFDEAILKNKNVKSSKLLDVYEVLFKKLKGQAKEGYTNIGIDRKSHIYIESMVDDSLAGELWSHWIRLRDKEEGIYAYSMMGVSFKGKFFKYLKNEVSSEIPAIKELVDHMLEIGDMSPIVFADVLMNFHKFYITDDRIRLFIAVHYLSQNRYRLDSEPIRPTNLYNR